IFLFFSDISAIMAGLGKDSRSNDNRKARRTLHHSHGTYSGPDVIAKKQLGSQKTPFNSDFSDPFGVVDFDVSYSMNKQKRWEAAKKPEMALNQRGQQKSSFIVTSVPRSSGRLLPVDQLPHDMSNLYRCGGGVIRFVTADNGEITDRKSNKKAHFKNFTENPGPGPQALEKKQLREEEKRRKRIERSIKKNSQENLNEIPVDETESEVQYTAMKLYYQRAGQAESTWRRQQSIFRMNAKQASARNRGVGVTIDNEQNQDALEDELDKKYSEMM
ncbi:hypothetical protein PFISCL1PPCAC_2582, partial [Pristionchus fissidentatus]